MRLAISKWMKTTACVLALSGIALTSNAQKKYIFNDRDIQYIEERGFSLGFTLGSTDLWGDVGTKSPIDHYINSNYYNKPFKNMRGMGGLFGRYTHVPGISFRATVSYGQLYATDAWNEDKARVSKYTNTDEYQRYLRNLDVHVNLWEGSLLFEFAPIQLVNWSTGKIARGRFQPYLLMGVAGFHFNPRGTYTDLATGVESLVELQPLRTAGQGYKSPDVDFPEHYSLWSYAAVGGIGFRVDVKQNLSIGLEYQLRFAMTDYLDDVSGTTYIDPLYYDIAHQGNANQAYIANRMADKTGEVVPGAKAIPGTYRGNEGNDMYSSINLVLFWKLNSKVKPWW